jgi:tetratricopeptide (TPR) repeat protein
MVSRVTLALVVVAALVLTSVAYAPALDAGFYFDDKQNIVEAPGVHWDEWSWQNLQSLRTRVSLSSRPVANLSFALNHLVGGLHPRGWHLVNVLIHLGVGLVLGWLVVELLRDGPPRSGAAGDLPLIAATAVLLFLVHPLNTQAVTYVVQRMAALAALGCLLALVCHVRARRASTWRRATLWWTGALAAWLTALGSKETAYALPLVIVTWEWCFRREELRHLWSRLARSSVGVKATTAAAALTLAAAVLWLVGAKVGDSGFSLLERLPDRDFSGLERVLTQGRAQFLYLSLLAWPAPSRLNLEHDLLPSTGLLDPPTTVLALIACFALLVLALLLALRRPLWGFLPLAYLELHLIESGPVNLELTFEHRMYLPMAMLAALAAAGMARLGERTLTVALVATLLLSLPLAAATRARNQTWADPVAFHVDCAEKSPGKARPQYNAGTFFGKAGRHEEALPFLERAAALQPDNSEAHNQLGNALSLSGRTDDALTRYRRSVELDSRNAEAVFNLANLLDRRGRTQEAARYYRRFVEVAPPSLARHVSSARLRLRLLETAGDH